ncbi:MAG: RluA family pseudouridine synthase [Timaviella obliquedivisa GSE-PSE-MK23-08B]|nr:RluA family pseudouridine synthase [Timaviella obliquedivisa GSE-PSE-MK23-08B]
MNQGWIYREQVKPANVGQTLVAYYTQHYQHSSELEWRSRIAAGQVWVNGQVATAETTLRSGQALTYHREPWEEPEVPLTFEVLYEDRDLLVIAKPAGLPVLPGGGFLEHTLLWQLQLQYPEETPVPIHRLGRGTSGLMLMARSPRAKSQLSKQMRDRKICKTYRALVQNPLSTDAAIPDRFIVTQAIGKVPHPLLGYIYGATATGQFAHSDCQVLQRNTQTTLLEVIILTGRPHQIRIHLSFMGYPLVGDPLYAMGGVAQFVDGAVVVPGDCGYWLHAYRLGFTHPRTGALMDWVCPPLAPLAH